MLVYVSFTVHLTAKSIKIYEMRNNSYEIHDLRPETYYDIRLRPFYRNIVGEISSKVRIRTLNTGY